MRVLEKYSAQYIDPLSLKAGDEIELLNKDEILKWRGWHWCKDKDGKMGWISESYFMRDGDKGKILKDYLAKELSVDENEEVWILFTDNGWSWCKKNSRDEEGWLPNEILEFQELKEKWFVVDRYFESMFMNPIDNFVWVLNENKENGLVAADISYLQGQFLQILAQAKGAKRVLEIGTLGGFSTLFFAKGVGTDGYVLTLEIDPTCARRARKNIERAQFSKIVSVMEGHALESLEQLKQERCEPFDLIFIDADKQNNPQYLEFALLFSKIGTLIIADNTVREGDIANTASSDEKIQSITEFHWMIKENPRLLATVIQTVGIKGHDGMTFAVVLT